MLVNSKIKIIQSLDKKKFRQKYNLFAIEGNKILNEIEKSTFVIDEIFSLVDNTSLIKLFPQAKIISESELKKISFLKNPSNSFALLQIKPNNLIITNSLQLVLDDVQDPGNLGTIIRLCDWFGIQQIICSENTVDLYNPKVIQASMGSFLRVNVFYTDLESFLKDSQIPIVATAMNGENLYEMNINQNSYLVLGNEGNGISEKIVKLCTQKITIPQFNSHQKTESLNVAMATSIIISKIIGK